MYTLRFITGTYREKQLKVAAAMIVEVGGGEEGRNANPH